MPKNFQYVLAAYGIWSAAFVIYLAYLRHASYKARRALARMSGGEPASRS